MNSKTSKLDFLLKSNWTKRYHRLKTWSLAEWLQYRQKYGRQIVSTTFFWSSAMTLSKTHRYLDKTVSSHFQRKAILRKLKITEALPSSIASKIYNQNQIQTWKVLRRKSYAETKIDQPALKASQSEESSKEYVPKTLLLYLCF